VVGVSSKIGIGSITAPESALQVMGARATTPTAYGVHIGSSAAGTNVYGMEICSTTGGDGHIDFTCIDENTRGRILYSNMYNRFDFRTDNNTTQVSISNDVVDCTDCAITTTGTISGNLNSTKGQLVSYTSEQSTALVASTYCFGHSSRYGMLMPFYCKLKKFCYASNAAIGSAYTAGTKIIFRLYADNVAQDLYAICDFARVQASATDRRISDKFSSDPATQTDAELSFSNIKGTSLSWYCYSLAGYNVNNTEHRFTVVVETTENL
jgi:hypothetical protein